MRAASWTLAGVLVLTVLGMFTVGHENDFGFACFLLFCADLLALAALGGLALRRRRGPAGQRLA